MREVLFTATLFVLVAGVDAQEKKAEPREKLDTAIAEGIRLLEKKEYKKFLQAFVKPADLKQFTEDKTIDAFAKQFAEESADSMLSGLKALKDIKPKMNKDETKATFIFNEKEKPKNVTFDEINFTKVGKYWYIEK